MGHSKQQRAISMANEPPNYRKAECCYTCRFRIPANLLVDDKCSRYGNRYIDLKDICDSYQARGEGDAIAS